MHGLSDDCRGVGGRLREWKKEEATVQAKSEIPGVGLLTATAAVATMGEAKAFRSG
jgi:transposase